MDRKKATAIFVLYCIFAILLIVGIYYAISNYDQAGGHILGPIISPTKPDDVPVPETARKLKGLWNHVNTCFLNALLQSLYASEAYRENVLQYKGKGNILADLRDTFAGLASPDEGTYYSPKAFVKRFRAETGLNENGQQEDSEEAFAKLFDIIEKAVLNGRDPKLPASQAFLKEHDPAQHFCLVQTNMMMCASHKESSWKEEPFYDLNLPIENEATLERALLDYFAAESMEFRCEAKEKKGLPCIARKMLTMTQLPQYLMFHLKRFKITGADSIKNHKVVTFPVRLNMAGFGLNRTLELYAVVVHSGSSLRGGHYYAYVKHGSNWYWANDSSVTLVPESTVLAAQAYLLFYK